ncbi:MAG: hypothetical protein AB1664_03665 [Thermodesulfobacteriota bacterium]
MTEPNESSVLAQTRAETTNMPMETPQPVVNPHNLGLQLLGVCIASFVAFFYGGLPLILAGVFTFADAWVAGIYKKKESSSFINISPMGWAIAMEGLLIVTLPLYLIFRSKLRTKQGNVVLFILAILFAFLPIAILGIRIMLVIAKANGRT